MPDGYYGSQLVASQADQVNTVTKILEYKMLPLQRVLKDLMIEKLPRLSSFIDKYK